METIYKIDSEIFLYINAFVGKSELWDKFIALIVNDYLIPVLASMILLFIWLGWKTKEERASNQFSVIIAGLAVGIANSIVPIIALIYFRTRPFEILDVNLLFYQPTDPSFPSNPICIIFAMAGGISYGNKSASNILYGLGCIYGFSRMYSGVCYPLDVIGGMLIGYFSALIAGCVLKKIDYYNAIFMKITKFFCLS